MLFCRKKSPKNREGASPALLSTSALEVLLFHPLIYANPGTGMLLQEAQMGLGTDLSPGMGDKLLLQS